MIFLELYISVFVFVFVYTQIKRHFTYFQN